MEEFHLPNFEPDTAIEIIRTTSPATILSSTEGAYFILDYCRYYIINAALTTKILLVILKIEKTEGFYSKNIFTISSGNIVLAEISSTVIPCA